MASCPFCAEEIDKAALKCKHCGEFFGERAPTASRAHPALIAVGIIVGLGGLCLAVAVVAAIAIPSFAFKGGRKAPNESGAIGGLKVLGSAQSLFRESDREKDQVFDYGTLDELGTTNLIDLVLGSGTKNGYIFDAQPSSTTAEFLWFATANPIFPGTTGDRYFAVNHEGVTYYSLTGPIPMDASDCSFPADRLAGGDLTPVGR